MNARISIRLRIALVAAVAAALCAAGFWCYESHESERRAESVMSQLEVFVPGIGDESGGSEGQWSESLGVLTIDGIDIAGALSIPALDIMAPVAAKDPDEKAFAYVDGEASPAEGSFRIAGNRMGLFRKLAALKPGDRVIFTDIYGVKYNYEVTTQYHLKNWDEGDNDLLLCYRTDSDTCFVVGCRESH